jgi:exodeoxyribonuclease V alpha subunit
MRALIAAVPSDVGVLQPFVDAGVFAANEVHLAATFVRLVPGVPDDVIIALAVAARGPRLGHVCVELANVARLVVDRDDESVTDLPWPSPEPWARHLEASDLVADPSSYLDAPLRPLVWDGRRLYLQRYFHHELAVANDLTDRAQATSGPGADLGASEVDIEGALDALFRPGDSAGPDRQRQAADVALTHRIAVIAGGPGTGKTRTIARLLAAARLLATAQNRTLEVALAAPTGKAAARMTEALHAAVAEAQVEGVLDANVADALLATTATTIHRLLGGSPSGGFRRNAHSPLPHDLVVVDEASMVSLPLMASLLEAVRPDAGLVLVGDPFQLASIEAGSVMSDVVGPENPDHARLALDPLAGRVTTLTTSRRFRGDSAIAALAAAVRHGDADGAFEVLQDARPDAVWVRDRDTAGVAALVAQLVEAAIDVVIAATTGDATAGLLAATRIKVLAATRHQAFGLYDWTTRIEDAVALAVPGLRRTKLWYVGRPIMVTANDHPNRLANGDTGLVVNRDDALAVAFPSVPDLRFVSPSQLDRVETWWAMTIHKSQGSEFPHAVVSLPPATSPILTRELLYTAVTRAREQVTIVGSEAAIRAAIDHPIARASGLRDRLWPIT